MSCARGDTEEAKPTRQIFVRMPEDLVTALDHYVESMRAKQPGTNLSRSDAIRFLLYRALALMAEAEEEERRHGTTP
jgi:hypothetical protein